MNHPAFQDIKSAHKRIKPYIHHTPVLTCSAINDMCDTEIFFKCENFQKAGAFKIRGATNAVLSLNDQQASLGVATHSSGNHAAALSLAARWKNIKPYVVMPENSPQVKIDAVRGYGAKITFCKPTLKAREEGLKKVIEETGATFIPPYNDEKVITGQGTAALELCEEVPNLDIVMAPVGGGGLLSGTAITVSSMLPDTDIIGAEPEKADDAYQSFYSGKLIPSLSPDTIADGLRTSLSDLTFSIIRKYAKDIVTVSEDSIILAMRTIWERMKIIVEPSSAVPLGNLLSQNNDVSCKRIGIILSGGNVDLSKLPWTI